MNEALKAIYRRVSVAVDRVRSAGSRSRRADPRVKRIVEVSRYLRLVCVNDDYLRFSKSQFGQDLLVQKLLHDVVDHGYFVEFGAVDGITNSNTYLFEKVFGWDGLVVEPAIRWHAALRENRSCKIDTRCVYSSSGDKLLFGETRAWLGGSALIKHAADDGKCRQFSGQYDVETVTLNDLLKQYAAPRKINFLSIDTEGSEYEILKDFDFAEWRCDLILVEHAHVSEKRQKIFRLMQENEYHRLPVDQEIAGADDWYASEEVSYRFSALAKQNSAWRS